MIIDVQNVFQYISTFEGKNYTKEIIVTARECSVSNCITWSAVYECQTCENDYALDTSKQWISTIPPPTDPDPIGSNSSTPMNNNTASNGTNSTTKNDEKLNKNEERLNKNEKIVSMSVIAILYISAVATSIISLSSPQSLWVSINHHQILMLLLLTGVYFPK